MPGMLSGFPIEYWVIQDQIDKKKIVQRSRKKITNECRKYFNRLKKQRK